MSVPLLTASRVSISYTEQICFISNVDTRTCSFRRTHVRRLFWLPMSCMSSPKTLTSTLFAIHVSSSY